MKAKILIIAALMAFTVSVSAQAKFEKVKITENVKQNSATRVIVQDSVTNQLNWVLKANLAPAIPDATTAVKGIVKLTGDLGGTADLPTTPTALHKTGDESATGQKSFTGSGSRSVVISPSSGNSALTVTGSSGAVGVQSNVVSGAAGFSAVQQSGASGGGYYRGVNSSGVTVYDVDFLGATTGSSFKVTSGLATQFLKANGTLDSNTYASDSNAVHKTGDESISGIKSFSNTVRAFTGSTESIIASSTTANAIQANSSSNTATLSTSQSGIGVSAQSASNIGLLAETSTGLQIAQFRKAGVTKSYIDQNGGYVISGGLPTQYLKADGSLSTLTNPVTGTGSSNFVPVFTSSSTIGNSNILNDASSVRLRKGTVILGDDTVSSNYFASVDTSMSNPANFQGSLQGVGAADISMQTSGGNVLIGTAVSTGKKLEVNGSIARVGGLPTQILMADGSTTTVLSGSATLNFPSTPGQTSTELTITVTGAADGDCVSLGVGNSAAVANGAYSCRVSAANTVTVKFNNYGLIAIDPPSGTFKVKVFK